MTLPEIIFGAVVLFVGVPAMLRNRTAAALVCAWLANQWAWRATGGADLTQFYLITDMFVMGAIYTKPEAFTCAPYRSRWHQLAAFALERSYSDRIILGIFAVMWCVYSISMDPYLKWAMLWWLALAQFFCAGGEAACLWKAGHSAKVPRRETPDRSELLRWGEAYGC